MPRRPPKRAVCFPWFSERNTYFNFETRKSSPPIDAEFLDSLHAWLKTKKIDYFERHGVTSDVKMVQEAFDALYDLLDRAEINERPINAYKLKHVMERKMPTYGYCPTEQAVLASLLYGCSVDFGPKRKSDSFTPNVYC